MDFTKICWYCHKNIMEATGSYYTCRSCGATWNEPPKLDSPAFSIEDDPTTGGTKYKAHVLKYRGVGKRIRRKKDATNV